MHYPGHNRTDAECTAARRKNRRIPSKRSLAFVRESIVFDASNRPLPRVRAVVRIYTPCVMIGSDLCGPDARCGREIAQIAA